ncbi:aspartate/glutamate racemase family protein [Cytobacillus pseudoceanisediminis]|uniref:Aspartate/glutamate racemase family protein n=1 Tax=Cytobacillus pseudoceanisediminis TaxID=3051614 RepID=A0ABZ2ZMZ7_9BACI
MGPFASAEFINTIYEENLPEFSEQESPRLILSSDPSIPDRTVSIYSNQEKEIVSRLNMGWTNLKAAGAEIFIIPCMTSHFYWNLYPLEMQRFTVNLVELVQMKLCQETNRYLLLATKGTYNSGLLSFKNVLIPNLEDIKQIHQLIYTIKCSGKNTEILDKAQEKVEDLLVRYQADGWICGCTELHLLAKKMIKREDTHSLIIDPLLILAKNWISLDGFLYPVVFNTTTYCP